MATSEIRAETTFSLVSAMFGANRLVRGGAGTGNRTPDLLITSEPLCRLSYPGGLGL